MFTQMSEPFTNIYNKFLSLEPETCHNIVLSLPSSKKEYLLKSFEAFLKICFHIKSQGQSFKLQKKKNVAK